MSEKKKFETVEDAIENFKDENLWISDAMEICEGKQREDGSGGNLYIKVKKAVLLEPGQILQIKSKQDNLEELRKRGFITDEQFEKRMKEATWVIHTISVTPRKKRER